MDNLNESAKKILASLDAAAEKLLEASNPRHVVNPSICTKCEHRTIRSFSYYHEGWFCKIAHIDEKFIARTWGHDVSMRVYKVPANCVFSLEQLMYNDKTS